MTSCIPATSMPTIGPPSPSLGTGNLLPTTDPLNKNTSPPFSVPPLNNDRGGLNVGVIIGIVFTVLLITVIVTLAAVLLVCVMKRRGHFSAKERSLINPSYDLGELTLAS